MAEKTFDFKKEYKDLYMPEGRPVLIEVPAMKFITVDGSGDPNNNPFYEQAVEMLYGLSYTIKMSPKKGHPPEGYFDYVVPPLEGLWWVEDGAFSLDLRDNWRWTMMIRHPEFVDEKVFTRACEALAVKKPELSVQKAGFRVFNEKLCVQIMHLGPYSTEPESMKKINAFIEKEGLGDTMDSGGKHHEIYLSDPRKTRPERLKTVLRHPVVRI